ncbi:AsmA family protein [Flavobacterium sp.]|jgi:AsmA protein|uniref:AsmA family protein n=1 Tax=Flavobacterium sp. TaxID=239 RepID=UPI0037C1AAE0
MNKSGKKSVFKIVKIAGISLGTLLLLLFLLPTIFPETLTNQVKKFANEKLNGELSFKETHLSFFTHFPSLTLSLDDFLLKGSAPFQKDTLIAAKEVAFGINLKSVFFDEKIKIDKIFISKGTILIKVNKKGEPNYNVYVSDEAETFSDSISASLKLERIDIKNTRLVYDDQSTKILINAKGFNYLGKGDLDKAVFDLKTKAQIESFDFSYDGEQYLKSKKVNASLITKINTNSLAFVFEENDLKINKLPVDFKGKFDFLKDGYRMDFLVQSKNANLNDFFTALPPVYLKWLEQTKIKGKTDLLFQLKGDYNSANNKMPNMHFNMKVRDGFISNQDTPYPAENIFLNFDTKLPSLDPEKLVVKIDSIYFDVEKDYFNGNVIVEGLSKPKIDVRVRSKLDLAKLDKAVGLKDFGIQKLQGLLNTTIVSKGVYDAASKQFPVTKGNLELKNGLIQTDYYPTAIQNINLVSTISSANGTLKDLEVKVSPASFVFEGKPFSVDASFKNFEDIAYNIKAKGELDIEKIYKVFSQKGLDVTGYVKMDVAFQGKQSDATNGNYGNLNNKGTMELREIKTTSDYFPKPFVINEGIFVFNQDQMRFSNFKATYGQSDFLMNGSMANVINFALSDSEVLKGNFTVSSNYINVDEFMSETPIAEPNTTATEPEARTETGVIVVPKTFDFKLNASGKKINFDGLAIENLKGNLLINKGRLKLQNSSFSLIGTKVSMSAEYYADNTSKAVFDYTINATDFDIKRAYNEVKMFREMASAAEYAEGIISLNYKIAGVLEADMMPNYPSLKGGGDLTVKQVKMKGFKLFNAVSKKTDAEGLKDPDISKVTIQTTIKNNIIKIEPFKFKVAGFRPKIQGESSLDGKLNIKMRLGLPPLGIIGIPIKITGSQDNPIIGVGKKSEDLEETEYEEGTSPIIMQETLPSAAKDSIK